MLIFLLDLLIQVGVKPIYINIPLRTKVSTQVIKIRTNSYPNLFWI